MSSGSPTSSDQASAGAICAALHRAYRDLRFYPPDHPMARQSLEAFTTAVEHFTHEHGDLVLEVREDILAFEGEQVYSHEAGRDNLAFLMFRDGVRSLSVYRGVEPEELDALVDCLAHADDLAAMEHDLVTALWEKDFGHIDYRVADPFLGGEVLREGMVDALRETVLRRLEDTVAAPGVSSDRPAWHGLENVDPNQIDSESLVLSKRDIERGEHAVETLSDVLTDFADVLLELAASGRATFVTTHEHQDQDQDPDVPPDPLAHALTTAAGAFLDEGDVVQASALFTRLEQIEGQGWSRSGLAGEVVGAAITAEHLRVLLQPDPQSREGEAAGPAGGFLAALRPWIVRPLLEILVDVDDRSVRREILELLGAEGGVPWKYVEPLLRDQRWYVVRNAVQLAAAAPHMELTEHGERLLAHSDVRVRREVLRALERIGGQTALRAVAKALSDEDSSVRTMAARATAREGVLEHEALLLARIEDRSFSAQPIEEVEAFLSAYAAVAQDRATTLLDKLWRKRLLSSRPVTFRAAAVQALGRVKTPLARAVLREASKSSEGQIQRAAVFAMQVQSSGTAGTGGGVA